MNKNSNIFERILAYALKEGIDGITALSKVLGYDNAEKLYRLKRNPEAKPSVDILEDVSNKFEFLNMNWVITGKGIEDIRYPKSTYTRIRTSENPGVSNTNKDIPLSVKQESAPKIAPLSAPLNSNLVFPKVVTVSEDNKELITVVAAKAAAGYLNGYSDPEYIENLPTLRLPGYSRNSHRAFELKGHSMGVLHHNSLVIGKWVESFDDIRDRYIYVLVTKSDGIVIKRVLNRILTDNKLILISDNSNKQDYPNFTVDPEDVVELWKLRSAIINNFPEPTEQYKRFNDVEGRLTLLEERFKQIKPSGSV